MVWTEVTGGRSRSPVPTAWRLYITWTSSCLLLCLLPTLGQAQQLFSGQENFDVRFGGNVSDASSGWVEVSLEGLNTWGMVCATSVDVTVATVVCRNLNFMSGKPTSVISGTPSPLILLDDVKCQGTETRLSECRHGAWGQHNCTSTNLAGVQCFNDTVSLQQRGNETWGYVDVLEPSRRRAVCGRGWEDADADVTCRQLGYAGGSVPRNVSLAIKSVPTSGFVYGVDCKGNETSLENCTWTDSTGVCSDSERARVTCYGSTANKGQVTVGMTSKPAGFVTISRDGLTTAVCATGTWGAANVTCKGLGYKQGQPLAMLVSPLPPDVAALGGVTTLHPACNGTEDRLEDCPGLNAPAQKKNAPERLGCNWSKSDTGHYYAVLCSNEDIKARIYQGPNSTDEFEGPVQLYYEGEWGVICDPDWYDVNAGVMCKQLGYEGGTAVKSSALPSGSTVHLGAVKCRYGAKNILECAGSGWKNYNKTMCADPKSYAAVRCHDTVRLGTLRAPSPGFGRVEVKTGPDEWSLVCGSGWGVEEAKVVCTQLGYNNGTVPSLSYSVSSRLAVRMKDVNCNGNETKLTDCYFANVTRSSPCRNSYSNHAAVFCYNGHIGEKTYIALDTTYVNPDFINVTGAVMLVRNGLSSRVCTDDWNDQEANVTCKQLGFKGGVAFAYRGVLSSLPVTFAGLNCSGQEAHLSGCGHSPLLGPACTATAGVLCYKTSGISVYTADGFLNKTRNAGTVIIEYDGQKGYICDSYWLNSDAQVVCKALGFVDGAARLEGPTESSRVTQSVSPLMHSAVCRNNEASIFMCDGRGWNNSRPGDNCPPAAVTCFNNVRLDTTREYYNPSKGVEVSRVQVFINNDWGGVCGTDFSDLEAKVVCLEMGYPYGKAISPGHLRTRYYPSKYKIWIKSIKCVGNETNFLDCPHSTDALTPCASSDSNKAAAICGRNAIDDKITSSITGSEAFSGVVKVTRYGIMGKVCSAYWDDNAANVVCRENGYRGGVAMSFNTYSRSTFWLLKYKCQGNESALSDCDYEDSVDYKCSSTKDVGVLCYLSQGVRYSISGERRGKGIVVISLDNTAGSVCSYGWGNTDAKVFCKSLGYMDGLTVRGDASEFGGMEPIFQYLSDVSCTGTEKTLLSCGSRGWNNVPSRSYCGQGHAAAVQCYHAVRIEDATGEGPPVGAIQVYFQNRWGYVCDRGWDDNDAKVMCLQLGFTNGKAYPCHLLGRRTSYYSYLWNNVNCAGSETTLADCPHDEQLYLSCPTGTYASVMCYDNLPSLADVNYKLTGTKNQDIGAVSMQYAGVWGRLCPNGWDNNAAKVLCRSIHQGSDGFGYRASVRAVNSSPYWLNSVRCTGNELTLTDCEHSDIGGTCGCDVTYSAGVYCYSSSGFEIRLGGGGANYGRVEIGIDGRWGTICDYGFGDDDASVVCRMMNYTSGTAKNRAQYGRGKGPYWLTNVVCRGNETSLLQCGSTGWDLDALGSNEGSWGWSCPSSHSRDAGVYCFGYARLQYGTSEDFGQVQVHLDDKWYQVCDDGSFDDKAANVVCRQLGYNTGKAFCCSALGTKGVRSAFETTTLTGVKCQGNETDIRQCEYVNGSACTQWEYVSVACSNLTENATQEIKVSVKNTRSLAYTGQLVVDIGGVVGRVCTKLWDDKDANVTCKQLGYKGGVAYLVSSRSTTPFVIGQVNCTGNETSLSQCPHTPIGSRTGCVSSDYEAGVLCYNISGIAYRMTNGGDDYGQIEISRDGLWGTVCSYGWGSAESKVFCKQQGFKDGAVRRSSSYVSIDKEMFISFVNCRGSEKNILECRNQGWANVPSYCRRYYSPVLVYCFNDVRLNNFNSFPTSQGAIEIFNDDEWKLVCDDGWDERESHVMCSQLGYKTGYAVCCNAYGYHYKQALYTNYSCTGNETNINQCHRDPVGATGDRCNYASVICVNDTVSSDYRLTIVGSRRNQYTGRLKLTFANIDGRICSDGWDNADAMVACREMNYPMGEAYTHYESSRGSSSGAVGPWWVVDVNCRGNETALSECDSVKWGEVRKCDSAHTAGVLCYTKNGTFFRLVNGKDNSTGRVEVSFNGEWGTVCDTYWDNNDARALCRQLGFVDGRARFNSAFGKGSGTAWMLRYMCEGTEDSLYGCPHQGYTIPSYSSCTSHNNDAGAECYSLVRLDTSATGNNTMGPVLFHDNNTWHGLCDDGFDDHTADLVCRSQGYAFGRAICCSAFGDSRYQLLNMTLNCTKSAKEVGQCQRTDSCESQTYASVFCFNNLEEINDTVYSFSISGTHKDHGLISLRHWSRLGRICADSWDDDDAGVFCREQGYTQGLAYYHFNPTAGRSTVVYAGTTPRPTSGSRSGRTRPFKEVDGRGYTGVVLRTKYKRQEIPYLLRKFNCTGREKSLLDCPHLNHTNMGECSQSTDAGAICFKNASSFVEFRLADGASVNEGRVEMAVDGVWGTICDQTWDSADAKALCRGFGYRDGVALKRSFYGPGNGTVWLSRIHCKGDETSLLQCPHEGLNASFSVSRNRACGNHTDDASVYCYSNLTIGTEPNKTHGVVRVYGDDKWNLVCGDSWTANDALVVCRQMGYPDGRPMPKSAFGPQNHNITIPYAKCKGDEKSLFECDVGAFSNNSCDSGTYASVYCSNETITDEPFAVRISKDQRSGPYHGLLEVRMDGLWGRICRHRFGRPEANVACKQLGFAGGEPYQHLAVNFLPIFMSNVSCSGDEKSLTDCNYTRWGDQYHCDNSVFEAGVICYTDPDPGLIYRLAGSGQNSTGRVEINFNNTWGTICDLGWGIADARVVCRQFGYVDGLSLSTSYYGAGTGPVWVQSFSCAGNETSLLTCPNSGWNATWDVYSFYRCERHGRDASVQCYSEKLRFGGIRLMGSEIPGRGRVEIMITPINKWGTVCDDNWDDDDATVLCRQLNFTSGKAVGNSRFGQGTGQIWLDEVKCTGNETSLEDCDNYGLGKHDCYHFEDAGVICSDPITVPAPPTTVAMTTTTKLPTPTPEPPVSSSPVTSTTKSTTSSASTSTVTSPSTSASPAVQPSSTTSTTKPTSSTTSSTTTSPTPIPTVAPTTTKATTTTTTTTSTTSPTTTTTSPPSTTTTKSTTTTTTTTPTPPTTTTTSATTSPSTTTNAAATKGASSGGPPIAAVVVPLLLIVLIAMAIIIVVIYCRHKRGKSFSRQRLQEDTHDLDLNAMPVAMDAANPNGKSHHFDNKLYGLSEMEHDNQTITNDGLVKSPPDDSKLMDHDYLTESVDAHINPLYTAVDNKKSSKA